jgi:hypothetical protein
LYEAVSGVEDRQEPMRDAEDRIRHEVVEFAGDAGELADTCEVLCLAEATIRMWRQKEERGELRPNLLGRPGYDCDSLTVRTIRELVEEIGYEVSVAYMAEIIDWVPRAIVEEVVRTYKEEMRRGRRMEIRTLAWSRPGRVWACDWTDPDATIDGRYKKLFVVRDLGSNRLLLTLPAERQSAELAREAMKHLFIVHGAPLVLKSDNGSEFRAEEFTKLLRDYGVTHLLSPEYWPQYNGAIEAGNGSLKAHTFYEALRKGRIGHWTADDVEAGRCKANETSRPWGWRGPSPDVRWAGREEIGCDEWEEFKETLAEERSRWVTAGESETRERKAQERMAITSALVRCGQLEVGKTETAIRKVANG